VILAAVAMLNAGTAKAQGLPSVAAGGVQVTKPEPNLRPAVANPQTAVACQMCFTCGGDWPVFAGEPRSFFGGAGAGSIERGGSCSGALATSSDTFPFLCCR